MIGMLVSGRLWPAIAKMSLFIDLLLIAAVLPSAVRSKPLGGFSRATVFWVLVFFGLCLPVALANGIIVMSRAEAIAGNRPYCIQYASQTDAFAYEVARTLFDLSALKMQSRIMAGGSRAYYFQQHGLLVVQDVGKLSFFNWSYFREDFLDQVNDLKNGYQPKVFCTPEQHYAKHLPIWWRPVGRLEFSIADRRFLIPETYRPRKVGEALVIEAAGPDFAAYDAHEHRHSQHWYDVRIAGENATDMSSIVKRLVEISSAAEHLEPQFNFGRIRLYVDYNGKRMPVRTLYTAYDNDGRLSKLIDCPERPSM
jgi:hypothetical protein